ncbi:unnamed protein product [Caenorhabditis auriculariae]|uniref:Uncharacterized protein n=1 Tax=Caenorhabditis auriculariae TaxID=2777116 RepID=A0A8S1GS35_9PELO|nr:unnamed protein product [Caenorhabditis auriculariae]
MSDPAGSCPRKAQPFSSAQVDHARQLPKKGSVSRSQEMFGSRVEDRSEPLSYGYPTTKLTPSATRQLVSPEDVVST